VLYAGKLSRESIHLSVVRSYRVCPIIKARRDLNAMLTEWWYATYAYNEVFLCIADVLKQCVRHSTGCYKICFFVFGATALQWAMASSFTRFLDHTQRRTTVGRTPLDEWARSQRSLPDNTHNTHNRQRILASDGIRTHNLSTRAAADLCLRTRGHWDRRLL